MKVFKIFIFTLTTACFLSCKNRVSGNNSDVLSVDTLDGKFESATFESEDENKFIRTIFGEPTFLIPGEIKIGCRQKSCYLTIIRPENGREQKHQFGSTLISEGKIRYLTGSGRDSEDYAYKLFEKLFESNLEESENVKIQKGVLTYRVNFVEAEIDCNIADGSSSCSILVDLKSNPRPE